MNNDSSALAESQQEEFEDRISAVLREIMPDLLSRAQSSDFGKWHRMTGLVDDLVQEAAYRFFGHCKTHQTIPENPLAYAVQIARHIVHEGVRKAKRQPLDLTDDGVAEALPDTLETDPNEDRIVYAAADLETLRIAVDMLPRGQKQAFELRNANPGSTDKELGVLLGISEDGFRKQFKRAIDRVTLYLKREG